MKSYPSLSEARVLISLRCRGGTSQQMSKSSRRLPAWLPLLVVGLTEWSWRQRVGAALSAHLLSTPCETKVDLSHQEVQTTGISSTVSKWRHCIKHVIKWIPTSTCKVVGLSHCIGLWNQVACPRSLTLITRSQGTCSGNSTAMQGVSRRHSSHQPSRVEAHVIILLFASFHSNF